MKLDPGPGCEAVMAGGPGLGTTVGARALTAITLF